MNGWIWLLLNVRKSVKSSIVYSFATINSTESSEGAPRCRVSFSSVEISGPGPRDQGGGQEGQRGRGSLHANDYWRSIALKWAREWCTNAFCTGPAWISNDSPFSQLDSSVRKTKLNTTLKRGHPKTTLSTWFFLSSLPFFSYWKYENYFWKLHN